MTSLTGLASTMASRYFMIFGMLLVTGWTGRLLAGEPFGVADCTTLQGKVMCGYQGWFRCPGDGSQQGWTHWSRDFKRLTPETIHVDLWPDMSEYSAAERFVAPGFTYEDGSPAQLFSSHIWPCSTRWTKARRSSSWRAAVGLMAR